ncbi:hypothetical protein BC827DRAFT_1226389 [Russula dissimulans]|nr:hypothetical protein BC827DRAFT_1226389 [Russula dissimulans]
MSRAASRSLRAPQSGQELRLPLISDLRGDTWDDGQQRYSPPLGLELTGYRLFTTSVIIGVGIPKAVCTHNGQSLISPTLDWVGGIIFAIIFFWLGEIGANRPELFPLFFQTDFGPPILKFLRRREVILWFISVLPLLLTTKQVQAVLDASGTPADLIKERFTVAVTAFSISILLFCSQFLNIVSPRRFEVHCILLFIISWAIWAGYFVNMTRLLMMRNPDDYQWLTLEMAVHNMLCTPCYVILAYGIDEFASAGHTVVCLIMNLGSAVCMICVEALLTWIFGFPHFPGGLYGFTFLCCMTVFFSASSLALIPTSDFLTYGRIRRAGRKVWRYVSGIVHEV